MNKGFVKHKLFMKVNGKCPWCGKPMTYLGATIEHIIPISLGGNGTQANLTLAHRECNRARGNNIKKRPVTGIVFEWITEILDRFSKNPASCKEQLRQSVYPFMSDQLVREATEHCMKEYAATLEYLKKN